MYGSWNEINPSSSTGDKPPQPAPNTAPLANASPAWKRRRVSEGQHGRRATKTTRACDSCKAKKARCSGNKPCTTCAEKNIGCSYESQYLRGRPPTPPSSTPEAGLGDRGNETRARSNSTNAFSKGTPADQTRSSPEPDSAETHGQYVDPTSGLSFLQRAQSRLKQPGAGSGISQPDTMSQPLTESGDKPLLGSTHEMHDTSNPNYHMTSSAQPELPGGSNAVELLELYFDVCISTYKPLHRPTVEMWFQAATNNIAHGLPMSQGLNNADASVLLTIFAIATFHRQKSRGYADDISSLSESDALFRRSLGFTETETTVAHLGSAQARILQVFYLMMTCRPNQAWYIFGSLLQIISALGMHRRDRQWSYGGAQPDYIHSQSRKRTFWSTYILDKYLGVVLGRPRHFHDDDIDQEPPDCVNDSEMSPQGRVFSDNSADCHMDAFVCNIRLARIVGSISHDLYPIKPLSETRRIEVTRALGKELDTWQSSLPPFLSTVKPSSLVRSFRRQCIALRLAYDHAVMHLYRPFLLNQRSRQTSPDTAAFRQEGIKLCIAAAQDALRTIDAFAQEGPLFHAFWWTHYITFCALTVIYVWNTQQPSKDIQGVDRQKLMTLAEQCQVHLAQATASNSPSRRYSIILEELRSESMKETPYQFPDRQSDARSSSAGVTASPSLSQGAPPTAPTFAMPNLVHNMENSLALETRNPFVNWQATDWLDVDASAYGVIPAFNPNVQWFGGI